MKSEKFILVSLNGGLGNQFFQYAHARSLAVESGADLYFDLSFFKQNFTSDTPRVFLLDQYHVQGSPLPGKLERKYRPIPSTGWRHRLARRFPFLFASGNMSCLVETSFSYNPILIQSWPVQIKGYWQSEKYFKSIRELMIKEFTLKNPPDKINQEWIRRISESNSICLHVRRGDYVTNPAAAKTHGLCGLDYYQNAIALMTEKIPAPDFYIFSDDPQWAKDHLKLPSTAYFVDCNPPEKGPEDLRLMQHCQHFITANSSFSWWAAWLGQDPTKIVVTPSRWFATGNYDTSDLYPQEWIKI